MRIHTSFTFRHGCDGTDVSNCSSRGQLRYERSGVTSDVDSFLCETYHCLIAVSQRNSYRANARAWSYFKVYIGIASKASLFDATIRHLVE